MRYGGFTFLTLLVFGTNYSVVAQDVAMVTENVDQNLEVIELRLDGTSHHSILKILDVFRFGKSHQSRGGAASVLCCFSDSDFVAQQLKSDSLSVRALFHWIRLLRIRNGELLDDQNIAKSDERHLDRVLVFVDVVSSWLSVAYPPEFRLIIKSGFTEANWESVFEESKIKLFEEIVVMNGLATFVDDPRPIPQSLIDLLGDRRILFHVWHGENLVVALAGSDTDSTKYAEAVCVHTSGEFQWKSDLNVWTFRTFRVGTFAFVRLVVSKDESSIAVFSVFWNSLGIEVLDLKSGATTFSFFSCFPDLIPLVPGEG